jgi:hypothetical protein
MKQKIEFYSITEGIKEAYPIIPIGNVKMPWFAEAKQAFLKRKTDYTLGAGQHSGTHMCSGIVDMMQTGWVVPAWHDLVITTNGDGESFSWNTPTSHLKDMLNGVEPVADFSKEYFADYVKLPPQTLKTVLKLHTPWRFKVPKGWGLMYLPLPYINETRFSSAIGILDPANANELHAILFWHELNSQTLIKAGTPLFQVIPVRLDAPLDFEVRDMNEQDDKWRKMMNIKGLTWVGNKAVKRMVYDKFFGGK